jgi:hypothetical protein
MIPIFEVFISGSYLFRKEADVAKRSNYHRNFLTTCFIFNLISNYRISQAYSVINKLIKIRDIIELKLSLVGSQI